MDIGELLVKCLWSGAYAGGMAILLGVPRRFMLAALPCGFGCRLVRDLLMAFGVTQSWSTAVASAALALIASYTTRRQEVSPVLMITGVLPLGVTVAMFHAITGLMKVAVLEGPALESASVAMNANLGKVLTGCLAIALGLGAGMAIVRVLSRERSPADPT